MSTAKPHGMLSPEERAEREAKLPRWARWELDRLRANARYDEKRMSDQITPKTVVWAEPYGSPPRPLGEVGQAIRFAKDPDDHHGYIDVKMQEDGMLEIHGADTLHVIPWVTNVVKIGLR